MRTLFCTLLGVLLLLAGLVAVPSGSGAATAHYYLALGDSLSRGYLPGQGNTDQGYADRLYTSLHADDPSLRLVTLGCSGETTATMLHGGVCAYPQGSQLAAAEAFLVAHRHSVRYLTMDIGVNDLLPCAHATTVDTHCLSDAMYSAAGNLATILAGLSRTGARPVAAGMQYYDPFLQFWTKGLAGQFLATVSTTLLRLMNAVDGTIYVLFGYRLADVSGAMHTDRFTPIIATSNGNVPVNVAAICRYTNMCTVGDVHANPAGYELIARVFQRSLGA